MMIRQITFTTIISILTSSCASTDSEHSNWIDITTSIPTAQEVREYFENNKEHLAPIEGAYLVSVSTIGTSDDIITQDEIRLEQHYIFRVKDSKNYNGLVFMDFIVKDDGLQRDLFYFYSKSLSSPNYSIQGSPNNFNADFLIWNKTTPTHISKLDIKKWGYTLLTSSFDKKHYTTEKKTYHKQKSN